MPSTVVSSYLSSLPPSPPSPTMPSTAHDSGQKVFPSVETDDGVCSTRNPWLRRKLFLLSTVKGCTSLHEEQVFLLQRLHFRASPPFESLIPNPQPPRRSASSTFFFVSEDLIFPLFFVLPSFPPPFSPPGFFAVMLDLRMGYCS